MRRGPNFTLRDRGANARLARCLNSVLDVKGVVAAFNQEKALVGAFSVITYFRMELFESLLDTPATTGPWSPLITHTTSATSRG